MCLVRRVMYVRLWSLEEEEAMVIYLFRAAIKMKKSGNVASTLVVDQLVSRVNTHA
jgi:hypothetical protein